MTSITTIHGSRQPRRPHHIADWAARRHLSQADIAREIEADKSLVSRWFSGSTPSMDYQAKLAALFHCEPEALFRDPDEDWLMEFFRGREAEEVARMRATLEAAFPRKRA